MIVPYQISARAEAGRRIDVDNGSARYRMSMGSKDPAWCENTHRHAACCSAAPGWWNGIAAV